MGYTQTFGGNTIYAASQTYLAVTFSVDLELRWPREQQLGGPVVSDIMDLDATVASLSVNLDDARTVSKGLQAMFVNVGANDFTVQDATGGTIITVQPGQAWVAYLTNNITEAGTWRTFQLGATIAVADAAALAGAGIKAIATTLNQMIQSDVEPATPFDVVNADRAKALVYTTGVGTANLPDAATVGADWFFMLCNQGSGDLTVTPVAGTIDGAATLVLSVGESATLFTDGANWFTIGFGQANASSFDFVQIAVPGTGDYTLSGVELNRVAYEFTGILTGDRTIIVPAAVQQYWVTNSTTGAFSFFVQTAAQVVPVEILQGDRAILYCNGTDVVNANSATVTFPIAVSQGGTGANTAAGARTNLSVPPLSRQIISGAGLTGGGDLSADRTLVVGAGIGIVANADDVAVDRASLTPTTAVGYLDVPVNSQSGNYTLVIGDRGTCIYHPSGGGAGDTFTIPANGTVAFPIGTVITFINDDSSNISIAITTDTMTMAGTTLTGTRTLGENGWATAIKVTSTTWIISGTRLT